MATNRTQQLAALQELQLTGWKYLHDVEPLLKRLHEDGCARDKAGNRQLHFDQYVALILLAFFNPILQSLRGIQQASTLDKVQKRTGGKRTSLGSLSEASGIFDPALLEQIIAELGAELPKASNDPQLENFTKTLLAVDGTLLKTVPQLAQAAFGERKHPDGWRLHTQFEILHGVPRRMDLTDGRNCGESNEKSVLRNHLQTDCCYVVDCGYLQFSLLNDIRSAKSSYVARCREDWHFTPQEVRPLSDVAQRAGVIFDAVGRLGSEKSKRIEHPDHPVRYVRLRVETHPRRGVVEIMELVIVTDMLDVPAEIIALIYRYRWSVELFFRFLKHTLGCSHLLSENLRGIQIQAYCAIIACMLISLWTGRKPTRRTYEMLCLYYAGWASEEELEAHVQKLKSHS